MLWNNSNNLVLPSQSARQTTNPAVFSECVEFEGHTYIQRVLSTQGAVLARTLSFRACLSSYSAAVNVGMFDAIVQLSLSKLERVPPAGTPPLRSQPLHHSVRERDGR